MSSEAITRNDLTAILNEVLPPTPSEYRKLLWTNPSPTSSFASQTLALDVNDYDAVCVEFRGETSHTTMCERGISYYTLRPAYNATPTYRVSSLPAAGGVYFDDCHKNSGSTIDNTQLVPYKIYGIKYERVAPPQADALEWRLAGTATGNTNTVTVPDSTKEVMVAIEATSGVVYTGMAVLAGLKAIWNVSGYYLSTSDIGLCNLNVSNSNKTFGIRNCRYGAGDYKTTAILSVYYR